MDMYQKRKIRAEKKNNDSQKSFSKVPISWFPGHMAKTRRQITEDLKMIDVVVEILDARIPNSSQNPDIRQITQNKKKIIILNKYDLADNAKTEKWIEYFNKKERKVVLADSLTGKGVNETTRQIQKIMEDEMQKMADKGRIGRKIRTMIVGIPNVGKSSFINRVSKKTSMRVGNKPGVTKNKQWIRLTSNVELLDTPGILWPKLDEEEVAYNLASMTAIKEEVLDSEDIAIYIIKKLLSDYPDNIINRYNLTKTEDIVDILDEIGKKIGAFRNSETDYDRVYKRVIKDLQDGYLGKITFDNIN